MAHSLSALLLSGVVAVSFLQALVLAAELNTCPAIENCMTFVEGPCGSSGTRTVCMEWIESTRRDNCALNPRINKIDQICVAGDHSTTIGQVGPGSPVCIEGVRAGADVTFAIKDGDMSPTGSEPRELNLPKTQRRPQCSAYRSHSCDSFSVNNIELTFTTNPSCQTCTAASLPRARMSSTGCSCRHVRTIGACSVTCGKGTQLSEYSCTGNNCPSTQIVSVPCRCGLCAGLFDGSWSNWGAFSPCAVNCLTNRVEKERRRTCTGRRRSAGGSNCVGAPTEVETCNTLVFGGSCKTISAPVPLIQDTPPAIQQQRVSNPVLRQHIPTTGVVARGPIDTCSKISKCVRFFFSDSCDTQGRRSVCISLNPGFECGISGSYVADKVCKEMDFDSGRELAAGALPFCGKQRGGHKYSFGIDDGRSHNRGAEPGIYTIRNVADETITTNIECHDYDSVCSPRGNNDLRITIDVPACP